MNERADLVAWIRGELVGPARTIDEPCIIEFADRSFVDDDPRRRGPLAWIPSPEAGTQEVLYYDRESPHRKYGAGLLHPSQPPVMAEIAAGMTTDSMGAESDQDDSVDEKEGDASREDVEEGERLEETPSDATDDFEVTGPDIRRPSSMGITFCAHVGADASLVISLPGNRLFAWQCSDATAFQLNGRYEKCNRHFNECTRGVREETAWRRVPAVPLGAQVKIPASKLKSGKRIRREVPTPDGAPLQLAVDIFPRAIRGRDSAWLITVVLRNMTPFVNENKAKEAVLYQAYFQVTIENGSFDKYPESCRPFDQLDSEEQSLALLYRESATWGIGHGCAAGWDAGPGETPEIVYADVLPAVELPSMTPDIKDSDGQPIRLSMRALGSLSDDGNDSAWKALSKLAEEYSNWISRMSREAAGLQPHLSAVARRHLSECENCFKRISSGIALLRENERIRQAFRLTNIAMLLQQISVKQLSKRPLGLVDGAHTVGPLGVSKSPWDIYKSGSEESGNLGSWRAFQIAFLLMSLPGMSDEESPDREVVDLIWFPTGGGKTEAYLAVLAFYMFHERILMEKGGSGMRRDGTNVLMRYTLRMLTTQQFQRAASLICAMEFLRRNPGHHGQGKLAGQRFSIGLWLGADGSPNNEKKAMAQVRQFRKGDAEGNPLVLTECPWCRSEIGRYNGPAPRRARRRWDEQRTQGISTVNNEGPLLHCTDPNCAFGVESFREWLPVEVIDTRIYRRPPSLVIATADKLAMVAFRPDAGALFGRARRNGGILQDCLPPGLIIQDELHLISGPLGTLYGLYEAIFERLCTRSREKAFVKPKIIASTATIRGASDQVKALYGRSLTQLFPNPGLLMGDSFFGRYARHEPDKGGALQDGRMYLGIHAADYGSVLTTQVRAFSSALFRPSGFLPEHRDAWWTLLCFYNSIRELSGAKTLFDSDIRSRLKFMFNRENLFGGRRRNLHIVEELTGRLSQAEIVEMMDRLSTKYPAGEGAKALDACLVSNIIEVGVDIDRLSLMGVVGQPKTTATYIQVTGRIGRRWRDRAGLVLMVYNPFKSRDRSHYEQFHSYHRRLYERVEPTSATPFALSAIQRALPGALLVWARQQQDEHVYEASAYRDGIATGYELLKERCNLVQTQEDLSRSLQEMERVRQELEHKWSMNPQEWEHFPQSPDGHYLMLWPGQYATPVQSGRGVVVPSSMRQVDGSAELTITYGYSDTGIPLGEASPLQNEPKEA